MSYLSLIITKFWPVLIPLVLYIIWLLYKKKKTKGAGTPIVEDKVFNYVIVAMIIILLTGFAFIVLNIKKEDKTYVPMRYEDNKLIPGEVK